MEAGQAASKVHVKNRYRWIAEKVVKKKRNNGTPAPTFKWRCKSRLYRDIVVEKVWYWLMNWQNRNHPHGSLYIVCRKWECHYVNLKLARRRWPAKIMLGHLTTHLEEEKWILPYFFSRINCKWIKFKHPKLEVLEDMRTLRN